MPVTVTLTILLTIFNFGAFGIMTNSEELVALFEALDHRTKHLVVQDLVLGMEPAAVGMKHSLPVPVVLRILEATDSGPMVKDRRALALARIDYINTKLMGKIEDGSAEAIKLWVDVQKRESALAGLDSPQKQETKITVEAPWLNAQRLSYRQGKEMASDIEAKVVEVKPKG